MIFAKQVRFWILFAACAAFGTLAQASLMFGDANYLGRVFDAVPASAANEAAYINNLKTLSVGQGQTTIGSEDYYRTSSSVAGPFPLATDVGGIKADPPVNFGINLGSLTYKYILAKYGNNGSLVWYSASGFSGTVMVQSTFNGQTTRGGGLSHISAYNPGTGIIPEPATLAVWSGLAVFGGLAFWKFGHA